MRTHILSLAVLWFPLTIPAGIFADEEQDAANLQQLLTEIQKVVPPGWDAEFELVDSRNPYRPGSSPALLIKSDAPLTVEAFNVMNLPGFFEGKPEPPLNIIQLSVTIRLVPMPYLSPQRYAQTLKENDQLMQRRIDFERDHLQNLEAHYKAPRPIPPNFYRPETKDEKKLVMQYAFLWSSTEPRRLPTHHTDELSYEMRYLRLDSIKIHDEKRSKEYEQILDAVHKIFVPYEVEP